MSQTLLLFKMFKSELLEWKENHVGMKITDEDIHNFNSYKLMSDDEKGIINSMVYDINDKVISSDKEKTLVKVPLDKVSSQVVNSEYASPNS